MSQREALWCAAVDQELATLDGTLGRVVYRDGDSHFTVARFVVPGQSEPVTVVGELVQVSENAPLRLRGTWVDDRKWGRQFRIETYHLRTPETLVGIERFLGAGLIPGIGPELARRLVAKFGMDTLEVVQHQPDRLTEVEGIGASRAAKIAAAWSEHRHVQDVMVFLRGHGVSAAFAGRIVKRYGKDAIAKVRDNPYRLAVEVWGIGFRTADAIAEKLGIARDAPARLEAGLIHVLDEGLEDGHLHVPEDQLYATASELLGVGRDQLQTPLAALDHGRLIVRETLASGSPPRIAPRSRPPPRSPSWSRLRRGRSRSTSTPRSPTSRSRPGSSSRPSSAARSPPRWSTSAS